MIKIQNLSKKYNDFYALKDILINDFNFKPVENVGGYEVSKKKGSL